MQMYAAGTVASVFSAPAALPTASPLIEGLTNPAGALGSRIQVERRAPQGLEVLTLPPEALARLEPALKRMNFRLDTSETRALSPADPRRPYTVAIRGDVAVAFLHFDAGLLGDGTYCDRVSFIGFVLRGPRGEQRPMPVRIVSVGAQRVAPAYKSVWAQWRRLGLDTAYVEWYDIEGLDQIPNEDDRVEQLRLILDLEEQSAGAKAGSGNGGTGAQAPVIFQVAGNIGGIDMSDHINVSHVVGPVNIKSFLEDVTQNVRNAPGMADDKRQQLAALIEELHQALQSAAEKKPEESQAVAQAAQVVATEAVKEKPNKGFLNITAAGLKQAAEALGDIAPTVLAVAGRIAAFVVGL